MVADLSDMDRLAELCCDLPLALDIALRRIATWSRSVFFTSTTAGGPDSAMRSQGNPVRGIFGAVKGLIDPCGSGDMSDRFGQRRHSAIKTTSKTTWRNEVD